MNLRKVIVSVIVFFLTANLAFSESVFLKDGSILEGNIEKENDDFVFLKDETGKEQKISRAKILRVNYEPLNKKKMFVYLKDKTTKELFLVSEDRYTYTFRNELYSNKEFQIKKAQIQTISATKIEKTVLKTKWGALLRSVLLPGWGQYYKGQFTKAYIYWGIDVFLVGLGTFFVIDSQNKKDKYEGLKAGSEFDKHYNAWVDAYDRSIYLAVGAGIFYIFNMFDALFWGKIQTLPNKSSLSRNVDLTSETRRYVKVNGLRDEYRFTMSADYRF
jgi:hypothetical protein